MIKKTICHNGQNIMVFVNNRTNEAGMSRYKNVVVVWDNDYDERVLAFVDGFFLEDGEQFKNLVAVREHDGEINLLFFGFVPRGYTEGDTVEVCDDTWVIGKTRVVGIKGVL